MKCYKIILITAALVLNSSANAALIDNGIYTTDTVTGLNWLDLSATMGTSYNDAVTLNPGYRYATNAEIENLFLTTFNGYYDTTSSSNPSPSGKFGYSVSNDGAYANQTADVFAFFNLFGTFISPTFDTFSMGYYRDENNILRSMGAIDRFDAGFNVVYGPNFTDIIDPSSSSPAFGTFLIQDISAVPVPAAVWLFGSGLIGLVGLARRKKT